MRSLVGRTVVTVHKKECVPRGELGAMGQETQVLTAV